MSENTNNENQNIEDQSSQKDSGETAPNSNINNDLLQKQIQSLTEQVDKYKNEYLYLKAEFDTYKRNVIKERSELLKYGSERLFVEMLSILDNFERALEAKVSPENLTTFVQGVEMTAKEFKNTLSKFGISEVESFNKPFDPLMHEALSSEVTSEVNEGYVYRVFKKAYKLHDKFIRPAQVVVAKKPS